MKFSGKGKGKEDRIEWWSLAAKNYYIPIKPQVLNTKTEKSLPWNCSILWNSEIEQLNLIQSNKEKSKEPFGTPHSIPEGNGY